MSLARHVQCMASFLAGIIFTGSLLGAQLSEATIYYVATSGNDSNPGTEAKPIRTVNKGVKGLKPGDTLYVKSGTYAEALNSTIPGGTSWNTPVTVAASPGHTVTLKPNAGTGNILTFSGASKKYIIVDGLILDGTNISTMGVRISHPGRDFTQAAHHIRIKNTEIKNIPRSGVSVSSGSDFNEFSNLRVHDTGLSGHGHGFYISSHNNILESSTINNNRKCGIQFRANGGVNGNIVRYNKVYNNGLNPSADNACLHGIFIGAGSNTLVYNNLVYGTPGGITIGGGAVNAKVYHNTTYGNSEYGIRVLKARNAAVTNNIVYGNGTSGIRNRGAGTVLSTNLTSDPLFVDPAKHNFKLQAASPAIDTGATLSEVQDDYEKVPRPQGRAYDIGAYEYAGSTGSMSLPAPMKR